MKKKKILKTKSKKKTKKSSVYNKIKILKKTKKKKKKIRKFKKIKRKNKKINLNTNRSKTSKTLLNLIRIQNKIKENFSFRITFDIFKLDKLIQSFFQKVDDKISEYKSIKADEARRIKIENIEKEKERKDREEIEKKEFEEKILKEKLKQIKEEEKLERERNKDIKLFLRKEQALLRKEQAERQKRFLQEIKLERQIEKFRIREIKELEKLERISLKEQREDYEGLQDRIEKLKEKYRQLRDQKIRERVEALGVEIQDGDSREILLEKEKQYNLDRQKIELALESFYRSANSLVFQLNKRYITRQMSIFRCIDKRFESGEIFIKWDESEDEEWLILIYIKDNSPNQGIVIEDKTNPEKNISNEFQPNEIFKASDMMVDSLTQLISRIRSKKQN